MLGDGRDGAPWNVASDSNSNSSTVGVSIKSGMMVHTNRKLSDAQWLVSDQGQYIKCCEYSE
jgi:hypothetical protein